MKEELLLSADEIEDVSEEEMEELEQIVDEYTEELKRHGETINDMLEEINDSDVYKTLGIQIHVSTEYMYSVGEREQ